MTRSWLELNYVQSHSAVKSAVLHICKFGIESLILTVVETCFILHSHVTSSLPAKLEPNPLVETWNVHSAIANNQNIKWLEH